jgi:hypothetical protein
VLLRAEEYAGDLAVGRQRDSPLGVTSFDR